MHIAPKLKGQGYDDHMSYEVGSSYKDAPWLGPGRRISAKERLQKLRREEAGLTIARRVSEERHYIGSTGRQLSAVAAFLGFSLLLCNAVVTTSLGWNSIWSNAVLVYLLAVGYSAGLFLLGHALITYRNTSRRAYDLARSNRESMRLAAEREEVEEDMRKIERKGHMGTFLAPKSR